MLFHPKALGGKVGGDHCHYSTLKRDPILSFLCVLLWEGILPGNLGGDMLFFFSLHFLLRCLLWLGAIERAIQ